MTDRYESRASTHAEGCWDWGPGHYGCAVGEIKRLREMLQCAFQRGYQSGARGLREMYDAVQAVKRQDAWGNTQLTEALLAAEERAEKAEAERSALLAERDALIHDNYEYVSAANELATENQRLREALKLAYGAMNYMGDILNGMDAVEPEDVDATSPAFEAVRAALAQEQGGSDDIR